MKSLQYSAVLLSVLWLTGCASMGGASNTQHFNGQTYKVVEAELGNPDSRFYFDNLSNPNQKIVVERDIKHPRDTDGKLFEKSWIAKEQQYRTNDCKLTEKHTAKTTYYICQASRFTSIYTFKVDDKNAYAKVWMDSTAPTLSSDAEQKIADSLATFYLP